MFKENSRKKGTRILKGLLRNLVYGGSLHIVGSIARSIAREFGGLWEPQTTLLKHTKKHATPCQSCMKPPPKKTSENSAEPEKL